MNIINPGQLLPLLVATLINILNWNHPWLEGTKKDVGVKFLSAPIPTLRLSHCPLIRISNVKPAHAEWYTNPLRPDHPRRIYTKTHSTRGELHLIYIYKGIQDVGNETFTHADVFLVALPLYQDSNLRDLSEQTGNVSKTSFRDWPYNWPEVSSNMLNLTTHPHSSRLFGANLHIFF